MISTPIHVLSASTTEFDFRTDVVRGLVNTIEAHGYRVVFQEYCECAHMLSSIGTYLGWTNKDMRIVCIRTIGRTEPEIVRTLLHELHHVQDWDWNCGSGQLF